jgi:hypothetical protein
MSILKAIPAYALGISSEVPHAVSPQALCLGSNPSIAAKGAL